MEIIERQETSHPFLDGHPKRLLIGGQWVNSVTGETFEVTNPATGKVIATVARGNAQDIDLAVRAARAAFEGPWSTWSPFDRQNLMLKIADTIEKNFDDLGLLETLDMGAPVARTSMFKRWMLQAFRFYAAQAVNIRGETLENSFPGSFMSYTVKDPIGVVGGIIPWNGPLITQLWSICPTLATGCTLVLKPAEEAPLSSLRLAELMMEAGLPDGVVNVVPGPGATAGAALAEHPDVNKIAFTGSTATGKRIVEASALNMKKVAVELGGKSPDIVFEDADLDIAVPGAAMGCFGNTGQVCYAGTRLFVQRSIHDAFAQRLADFAATLRVGDSCDPATQLGPLVSKAQLDRVTSYVDLAQQEGARVMFGGERLGGSLAEGYFVTPTVLAGVNNDMRVAREEIFGPVISIIPFDDEAEVIHLANQTEYGLGGAVWTRDVGRAHRVSRAIKAGILWVNCYGVTDPSVSYGGTKMSGYGSKGGPHHIEDYLYSKTVWLRTA
ncbi:aldehyde dehydrogenase family protein [Novosphingobium sp. FGD1]|uniref:Aldehyde dehydrogenase family protein n=1 Tax=Novosphingobium silvae TaxID=2692619 RepID=A0A7X4GK43_9SPHN|nr:aldehyde dehydrogenase family protein [Novosphingobium silvae]MYM00156.1 aldehyde dehydrogenase family protein [Novosphingobium silvae]